MEISLSVKVRLGLQLQKEAQQSKIMIPAKVCFIVISLAFGSTKIKQNIVGGVLFLRHSLRQHKPIIFWREQFENRLLCLTI